jgi:carbon monoxide dehydrogenase subunit G
VLKLRPIANGETELAYRADVQIQGRLAILGDMMLRSTSALMLEELTKRLRTELERRTAEPNDPSPAPA